MVKDPEAYFRVDGNSSHHAKALLQASFLVGMILAYL